VKKFVAICLLAALLVGFSACGKASPAPETIPDNLYFAIPEDPETPLLNIIHAVWMRCLELEPILEGMPLEIIEITGKNKMEIMGDISVEMEHAILLDSMTPFFPFCIMVVELNSETNFENQLNKLKAKMPVDRWEYDGYELPVYTRENVYVQNHGPMAVAVVTDRYHEIYLQAFEDVIKKEYGT